jgi:hypothetical protein
MPLPLWLRVQQLRVVVLALVVLTPVLLAPVLLAPVLREQQRGRPERRQVQPQHKATLVGSRFVSILHACRGAGAHADPRKLREASVPA